MNRSETTASDTPVSRIRDELLGLMVAMTDPRTPWYAKALAGLTVGLAVSPIDPIPDLIPVIGQLDDLVFIPVGAWLTYRLTPEVVLEESGSGSFSEEVETVGRLVGVLVILGWGLIGVLAWALLPDLVQTFRPLWPG